MRFQEIKESTTTGSISTVAKPIGETQKRTQVSGLQPAEKVMQGSAKKKGPYANSLTEGKVKELSMDLKDMKDNEFQSKYKMTKAEAKKNLTAPKTKTVSEAELSEDDVILVPGKGLKVKPGFHKIDPDKTEHEGETLKNSLHTIIRVATHLNKELSTRDNFPEWVSEKIGAVKSNMVNVMDYLISSKEMKNTVSDEVDEGEVYDLEKEYGYEKPKSQPKRRPVSDYPYSQQDDDAYFNDIFRKKRLAKQKQEREQDHDRIATGTNEGAKVDRMVKHVAQTEKKLGHTKKEAENIAWATANKRGMLDNKNKKK